MLSERFERVLSLASRFAAQGNEAMLEQQQDLKLAESEVSTVARRGGALCGRAQSEVGRETESVRTRAVAPGVLAGPLAAHNSRFLSRIPIRRRRQRPLSEFEPEDERVSIG